MHRTAAFALFLLLPSDSSAYSVLAHQAVIDSAWESVIVPAIQTRFAGATSEVQRLRAFAYGGCLIQDLGYYPFASRFFGNLTHYVRSGDFVAALMAQASNADEFAFALGALAHHAADTRGHAMAVNRAVPLVYPELRAKFGDEITYEEHRSAHLKTEFGFDVLQVARGRYAPDAYRDFIGFEVAKDVLARAFRKTYGLELKDVFGNLDFAITTFRWTVTALIPEVTKIAWQSRRKEIEALDNKTTQERFVFTATRADFEKRWGTNYKRPNFFHRMLTWMLKIVPRFGPFKPLAYRTPTPEAERLFVDSFAAAVARYGALARAQGTSVIENANLDTGAPAAAGDYGLMDETYAELLERLDKHRLTTLDEPMRRDILRFFAAGKKPSSLSDRRWRKTARILAAIR